MVKFIIRYIYYFNKWKNGDCTLKLYTQKVDELVAEKVAANTLLYVYSSTQQVHGEINNYVSSLSL